MTKSHLKTSTSVMKMKMYSRISLWKYQKEKTVALVGQSGSGKSTIANLLTRFYDVQEGNVKVDGIDIKDITIAFASRLDGLGDTGQHSF